MKIFTISLICFFSFQFNAAARERVTNFSICAILNQSVAHGRPEQKLNRFFQAQWKYLMTEYPEWATSTGYPGQNDRWTDMSLSAIERRKSELKCQLTALQKIPGKKLTGESRVNFELSRRRLEMSIEGAQFDGDYLVLNHLEGMHIDVPDMLISMPTANKQDYMNILSRLEKVPQLEAQTELLLSEGLKHRVTPVKMFLARVPAQFDRLLTATIEDSPLYKPFADMNMNLDPHDKAELQYKAHQLIQNQVYPAFERLKKYVVTEYIPGARESIAMSDMPNGKAWYAFAVKDHTTTDMTPEQLHDLGLREVARITKEMEKIRDQVHFHGDLKAFNKFLLTDKKFFYQDKADLLMGYRDIAKRIDPELPKEFKTLPRLTYGVREMPDYKSADAPAAYYDGGSLESGRPGYFEANTSDLSGRPKWGMEALTLHEAVPGHHLQLSLAQELSNLPDFRKHESYTAFVEGWGLYAEGLGDELGLYKDPYSKYGQLSYEMWRAIRLVVDTGIHAQGWTRQQAIDYFAENMPKSKTETENEVDRYITWPGQALAYKVGQLKFLELRKKAQAVLGDKFDIREFHDQLLKHGSLPLDVLEKTISQWITEQQGREARNHVKDRAQM